jgi:hypothetical protein
LLRRSLVFLIVIVVHAVYVQCILCIAYCRENLLDILTQYVSMAWFVLHFVLHTCTYLPVKICVSRSCCFFTSVWRVHLDLFWTVINKQKNCKYGTLMTKQNNIWLLTFFSVYRAVDAYYDVVSECGIHCQRRHYMYKCTYIVFFSDGGIFKQNMRKCMKIVMTN